MKDTKKESADFQRRVSLSSSKSKVEDVTEEGKLGNSQVKLIVVTGSRISQKVIKKWALQRVISTLV